jgi:hypothetical protein
MNVLFIISIYLMYSKLHINRKELILDLWSSQNLLLYDETANNHSFMPDRNVYSFPFVEVISLPKKHVSFGSFFVNGIRYDILFDIW